MTQRDPVTVTRHQVPIIAKVVVPISQERRLASVLFVPVMLERMAELWRRLRWQAPTHLAEALNSEQLLSGTCVVGGPPLFPRYPES